MSKCTTTVHAMLYFAPVTRSTIHRRGLISYPSRRSFNQVLRLALSFCKSPDVKVRLLVTSASREENEASNRMTVLAGVTSIRTNGSMCLKLGVLQCRSTGTAWTDSHEARRPGAEGR